MHFHMNEKIDNGRPVNNGTDRHRDCLADSLRAIIPAFQILGWELTSWQIHDLQGNTTAEFTTEDGCGETHTLSLTIWACECSTGEQELRERDRRRMAALN